MDTYFIKLQGKANIPEPLEIDSTYRIAAECSITQEKRDSNENGEFAITFKAEPLKVEILSAGGKIIKAKDPRRNSQKVRNYLFKHYHEEGFVEPFDDVYDAFTMEVMVETPVLLRRAIERLNKNT